jgi:hypothetical protein
METRDKRLSEKIQERSREELIKKTNAIKL